MLILAGLILLLNVLPELLVTDSYYGIGAVIGGSIGLAIGLAISWFCAKKCAEWSGKLDKNVNVAFVIGFLFSLLALVVYGLYYAIKRKKR